MTKFLRMTSLVATVAGLAIATPAVAVTAVDDADATVEIRKGLTLDAVDGANLDLGVVVLSGGAGPWSAIVEFDPVTGFDCSDTDVTCSGTPTLASYDVTGSAGYVVDIDSTPVTLTNAALDTLILTPLHADTVTLDATTGAFTFDVGGRITVTNATPDGVYNGTFAITAEYN